MGWTSRRCCVLTRARDLVIIGGLVALNAGLGLYYFGAADTSGKAGSGQGHATSVSAPTYSDVPSRPGLGFGKGDTLSASLLASIQKNSDKEVTALRLGHLSDDELASLAQLYKQWLAEDSPQALKWLRHACDALTAAGKPQRILFFMEFLNQNPAVRDLERHVVHLWTKEGADSILAYIKSQASPPHHFIDAHLAAITTSVMLHERADSLDQFLSAIGSMDTPELRHLQGVMTERLIAHAPPDKFDAVADLLEAHISNPRVALHAIPFAAKIPLAVPTVALEKVAGLKIVDQQVRTQAIGQVLQRIGIADPTLAAAIFSADEFFDNYYRGESKTPAGEWTPQATAFFDETLEAYVQGVMTHHPELAVAASDAFFAPEKRTALHAQATALLTAEPISKDGHHCPHCAQTR